ncbi:MAG: PrsW family glutamic-type intramembrane protease [Streptococcus salivarius]
MFRKLILYLFLLLSAIGLTYDTQSYTSGALSGSAYGIIGLSTLIALCYIVPGIFLIQYLGKRWQVKPLVLIFALIGGLFITGWIAGYANTFSHDWVTAHLSSKSFFYRFEDALMAPLVEEPLKLAAFLFAIYMVPTKSYKGLLLVAITAGLGFQISEDFSIFFQICLMVFLYGFRILGRTIGAVSSHWLYTSFLAMGLVLIWRSRQKLINSKYSLIGMLYACGAFAAHFAWNSPLRNLESDLPWASGLLISLNLFFFITLYQLLSKLDEENK